MIGTPYLAIRWWKYLSYKYDEWSTLTCSTADASQTFTIGDARVLYYSIKLLH